MDVMKETNQQEIESKELGGMKENVNLHFTALSLYVLIGSVCRYQFGWLKKKWKIYM